MNITEIINATNASSKTTAQIANTQSKEDFSSYLDSSCTTMDDIFQKASDTYGVPVCLLKAIAKQESNFDPNATSHSGARGIMQLMPETAAGLGVTDAYDPQQNIMAGSKYISQLLEKYNGNINLALAAYNAGPGNVSKYGGIPPFKETQNYVVKVNAYMNENIEIDGGRNRISSSDLLSALNDPAEAETASFQDILEEIFSYEDYMRFLDLYLEQLTENKNSLTGADSRHNDEDTADNLYSLRNIRYNPAVVNLLNQQTKI